MGFHGSNNDDTFELIVAVQSLHANSSQTTKKAYPGATLTHDEVAFVERQLVGVAQSSKPSHRDADWDSCHHSKTDRGSHSSDCWKKQRKALWKAYAKACIESMARTGRRLEPLDAENTDVPAKEVYFTCECARAPKKFAISVWCGNVSWKKV